MHMQVVGYETETSTSTTTVKAPSLAPLGPTPGVVTPAELPKSAVVNTNEDGTAEIEAKQQPGYLASAAGIFLRISFRGRKPALNSL